MPKRKCLTCPKLITEASYCEQCRSTKGHDAREYRRNRDILITAWVEEHGWVCPGDEHHAPHPTSDLQADHIVPPALGGTHALDNLRVRCGSSNRRRAWRAGRVTSRARGRGPGPGLPKHNEHRRAAIPLIAKGIHNTYKTKPPEKNGIFWKHRLRRDMPRHFNPRRNSAVIYQAGGAG